MRKIFYSTIVLFFFMSMIMTVIAISYKVPEAQASRFSANPSIDIPSPNPLESAESGDRIMTRLGDPSSPDPFFEGPDGQRTFLLRPAVMSFRGTITNASIRFVRITSPYMTEPYDAAHDVVTYTSPIHIGNGILVPNQVYDARALYNIRDKISPEAQIAQQALQTINASFGRPYLSLANLHQLMD